MKMKLILRNVAPMVVFGAIGLISFTEGVRTVQILGIFACGMVVGASLTHLIMELKAKQKTD
jgi:predicted metal-binding protein